MLNIILTLDYEIFGDGRGDVRRHMIKPTRRILDICDKHEVPMTIMFEAVEYGKFLEFDSQLRSDLNYSPGELIRDQVVAAARQGHDVQLHIHPQWMNAVYQAQRWIMENPERAITDLSPDRIHDLIGEGKDTLGRMMAGLDRTYAPCLLRLTNLPWTEAPEPVFRSMRGHRLLFHSLATADSPKNTPKGYWQIGPGLFEIPVHSRLLPKYRSLTWNRIKTAVYRSYFTRDRIQTGSAPGHRADPQRGISRFVRMLLDPRAAKWDFCKQSHTEMMDWLYEAMHRYDYDEHEVPLVMIGHSKDFFNQGNLEKFLSAVKNLMKKDKQIRFSTFSRTCSSILDENPD